MNNSEISTGGGGNLIVYPNTNIMSISTNITAISIYMAAYDLYILMHFFSQEPLSNPGTQVNSFSSFFFFWSGLQGPKAYSLRYGVVPKPSIG